MTVKREPSEQWKAMNAMRIDILEGKIQAAKDEEAGQLSSSRTRRLNEMKVPSQKEMDALRRVYPDQVVRD